MSGFRKMLCGYGPVTASLSLLDGLRIVDFLAGTTIVEYNTGHFDEAHHLDAFVEQVLAYALLAPGFGHPVTAVVLYLARYHVLTRYPLDTFLAHLAGQPSIPSKLTVASPPSFKQNQTARRPTARAETRATTELNNRATARWSSRGDGGGQRGRSSSTGRSSALRNRADVTSTKISASSKCVDELRSVRGVKGPRFESGRPDAVQRRFGIFRMAISDLV